MNARLLSDAHLDFYQKVDEGFFGNIVNVTSDSKQDEILFLAGDICEWRKTGHFMKFFEWVSAHFHSVVYVLGNHEHYYLEYPSTKREIRKNLEVLENVFFLDLEDTYENYPRFVDINGYRIIGTTLWTDFKTACPMAMFASEQGMADYRVIFHDKGRNLRITSDFIYVKHLSSKKMLSQMIGESPLPVIVMTHHAPHEFSRDNRYPFDDLSYSFFSNAAEEILKYNKGKVKYWFHGHIHTSVDYVVHGTRIISNPLGYPNQIGIPNENLLFDASLSIIL